MHVVFGANGRAGGETARALIERGAAVRVVLRRREQAAPWEALGVEVASRASTMPARRRGGARGRVGRVPAQPAASRRRPVRG